MKKILSITTSYPIHPRLKKITNLISKEKEEEIYYSFNLGNMESNDIKNNEMILQKNFKDGIIGKGKRLLILISETRKILSLNKVDTIVSRGLIPLVVLFFSCNFKNYKIYYDVHDLQEGKMKKIYSFLEKILVKKVDKIILSSRFFEKFYKEFEEKIILLENNPSKKLYNLNKIEKFNFEKTKIILSFIGVVRYYDVLKNLIKIIKNKNIDFLIFGTGSSEEKLKKYCEKNRIKNVYFFGRYSYQDLNKFYNISDFVWAAYDYREENVKYAISNKFFEALAFDKIGIYSKNTELGTYVEENKIGLTVDPFNLEELEVFLEKIKQNNYENIHKNIIKYKKKNIIYLEELNIKL